VLVPELVLVLVWALVQAPEQAQALGRQAELRYQVSGLGLEPALGQA